MQEVDSTLLSMFIIVIENHLHTKFWEVMKSDKAIQELHSKIQLSPQELSDYSLANGLI